MIITSQGFGHFVQGINNQDFGFEKSGMILVLDGCSSAKYSEVGTRLFTQLFAQKEEFNSCEKFEDNVKSVFDELIEMMRKYYQNDTEFESEFIMENLLFTILACFETEDKFIVKIFGDGYIITQNMQDKISYMRFAYGKFPPYFAYRYCQNVQSPVHDFKTFEFDKKSFKKVGIGTDGVLPIVKGEVTGFDGMIIKGNELMLKNLITNQRQQFFDDVTIGFFEGGSVDEESI